VTSAIVAAGRFALRGVPSSLSRIGLGTWAFGGQGWRYSWGRQDDAASLRTIDAALDVGIDWLDTAPVYGVGHAEELVGKALRGRRTRVVIATKCGFLWQPGSRRAYPRLTAASVFEEVEASLRRLRTDYIDLYQVHWPGPNCDLSGAWESICRLIEAGKVRCGGVCNLSPTDLGTLRQQPPPASLQVPCNILQPPAPDLVALAAAAGIGIVGYSPLASGMLCHGFSHARRQRLAGDDWRRHAAQFNEPQLSAHLRLINQLRSFAVAHDRRVEHYALAWALRHAAAGGVLLGARSAAQLLATAASEALPEAELAALEDLLNPPQHPPLPADPAPERRSVGHESDPPPPIPSQQPRRR
jgi:aryl-alcohol dehydrogenase-like predicted oxidoreductase